VRHAHRDGPERLDADLIATHHDGPERARLTVRGRFDAVAIARLAVELEELVANRTRFITIHAAALTACEPGMLSLLGRTQRRLESRRGMLTITGLPRRVLPDTESTAERDWELAR
jgi:hypothetical protein